jgi:tRNA A37 threonylcarbamoyladenosine dehydratase
MSFPEAPITIYTEETDDDKLIKFIRKELRNRNFYGYGYISLVYPPDNNLCKSRKCCDTR